MNIHSLIFQDALTLAHMHGQFTSPWQAPWSEKSYGELLVQPSIFGFKYKDAENVAGFILLQSVPPEAEILFLGVSPPHQKKGIATRLLVYSEQYVRKNNIEKIFLDVCTENNTALEFYKKNAYVNLSVRKNYYSNQTTGFDALILEKGLSCELLDRENPTSS